MDWRALTVAEDDASARLEEPGMAVDLGAVAKGFAAQRALRLAEAAIQRLGAQVNPKIVLSVFAAKFRAL